MQSKYRIVGGPHDGQLDICEGDCSGIERRFFAITTEGEVYHYYKRRNDKNGPVLGAEGEFIYDHYISASADLIDSQLRHDFESGNCEKRYW